MPQPIVDNPWGLTPRAIEALDAYVTHGGSAEAARHLGRDAHALEAMVCRSLDQLPPAPRLHRLMWWREYRGLVPMPEWPPMPESAPYGLSVRQARVWDLYAEGASVAEIAERLDVSPGTVHGHIKVGALKIPGERMGNKQAAWKRARACGNE